ncbi:hypothetical protein GR168_06710 [Gordonia sp. JH63]|nr:hypothetical protein GR168_06710 [Gordonia sp. JH63]
MRRLIALFATAMSACAVAGCGWIAEVVSTRVDAADYFTAPTVRLLDAARRDDRAQIESLLAQGADLHEHGGDPDTDPRRVDITPLQWAVEFEPPGAVAALPQAGADPHLPGAGRYNAVAYSVLLDRFAAFRTLIGFDAGLVEASDRIGGNVVHTAVRHRRDDALRLLIDRGADLDSVQPLAGRTPLFTAADVLNIDHCLARYRREPMVHIVISEVRPSCRRCSPPTTRFGRVRTSGRAPRSKPKCAHGISRSKPGGDAAANSGRPPYRQRRVSGTTHDPPGRAPRPHCRRPPRP